MNDNSIVIANSIFLNILIISKSKNKRLGYLINELDFYNLFLIKTLIIKSSSLFLALILITEMTDTSYSHFLFDKAKLYFT